MKKIILLIADGMGDRPCSELNGQTPLQAALTPNMDYLAKNGLTGQMHTIDVGVRCGSDTSHLAILGYNPYDVYTGRGPFEAIGLNMETKPGDIAFRCNFATVDENMVVLDRRAGRIKEGTKELIEDINGMVIDGVTFYVEVGVEHRAALIMRGPNLSAEITDIDPHGDGEKIWKSQSTKEDKTAEILNKFVERSYEILKVHPVNKKREEKGLKPANILLTRGAGIVPHLKSFQDQYRLKGACIAGIPMITGICGMVGLKAIVVEGATGGLKTNMVGKLENALNSLCDFDFVLINIKAPDICGHDNDPVGKKNVIEDIDKAIGKIRDRLDDVIFVITADHSTPCSVMDHSGDSVPLLIYGTDVRTDYGEKFDEISVTKGSLNIKGTNLLPLLLNLSDRAEKFGA